MDRSAKDVIETTTAALAPSASDNRLVPLIATGTANRRAMAALALEQQHIIASDRRSFGHLAERSAAAGESACAAFFGSLAQGEETAAERLGPLAAACGLNAAGIAAYEPTAGCQAYPSYVARLALTGEPAGVALALTANFSTWGGYCVTIARALRAHYGFDDEACGFFDFFGEPAPSLDEQATAAVQAGLDGGVDLTEARRQGRLLQTYESMFWNTVAELA